MHTLILAAHSGALARSMRLEPAELAAQLNQSAPCGLARQPYCALAYRQSNTPEPCLHCSVIRNACLTVLPPQPRCSSRCRDRSFRVSAYGPHAAADVSRALRERVAILDPLNSFTLRHLEKDIFAEPSNASAPARYPRRRAIRLLWPKMETGYGDFIMSTMLPLGCELHRNGLHGGDEVGMSGVGYPGLLTPLLRAGTRVCTFERTAGRADGLHRRPAKHGRSPAAAAAAAAVAASASASAAAESAVARCESACHDALHVCELGVVTVRRSDGTSKVERVKHRAAYDAAAALDAALGLPLPPDDAPPLGSLAVSGSSGASRVLRVLLARRHGRRYLTNIDEVTGRCNAAALQLRGWSLECRAVNLGQLAPLEAARAVRRSDVLVTMHGGDSLNALHLLPGRTLVELVNCGFQFAHWEWLDTHKMVLTPVVRYERLVLPPTPRLAQMGNMTAPDGGCGFEPGPDSLVRGPALRRRQKVVQAAWNADGSLPWPLLEGALRRAVGAADAAAATTSNSTVHGSVKPTRRQRPSLSAGQIKKTTLRGAGRGAQRRRVRRREQA